MKKILFVVMAFVLFAVQAFAAGSVTVTKFHSSKNGEQVVFKLACVGDASNGSVPATEITDPSNSNPYQNMGLYLYEVWTVTPGSGNPDAADIAITDELGASLYSEANVISGSASTKTSGTVPFFRQVNSKLTVTVSNQATASATYDIYIKLAK
jgi:hypothetical protein